MSTITSRGTRNNQPAASTVTVGFTYYVTDEDVLEASDGTNWIELGNVVVVTGGVGGGGGLEVKGKPDVATGATAGHIFLEDGQPNGAGGPARVTGGVGDATHQSGMAVVTGGAGGAVGGDGILAGGAKAATQGAAIWAKGGDGTSHGKLLLKTGPGADTSVFYLLSGTVDPSADNGVNQNAPALYVRDNSGVTEVWVKTGAAATAWTLESGIPGLTASAAELNLLDGITAPPVQVVERTFTETAAAGTYTGTVAIPAGATVLDVIWRNTALWTADTSASLEVGDDDDANGYIEATDVKAAPSADTNGAGAGISTRLSLGATVGAYKGGGGRFCATAKTITATVTTVGTTGTAGRSRLLVEYALPSTAAASKI